MLRNKKGKHFLKFVAKKRKIFYKEIFLIWKNNYLYKTFDFIKMNGFCILSFFEVNHVIILVGHGFSFVCQISANCLLL